MKEGALTLTYINVGASSNRQKYTPHKQTRQAA
jgi:hypothetical protein